MDYDNEYLEKDYAMKNELLVQEPPNVLSFGDRKTYNLAPRSLTEAMEFSKMICNSELVPSSFRGKAESVLIAIQMGAEIGLHPIQALQNIAVINGRPSLWGDAMLALCMSHPQWGEIIEEHDDTSATCHIVRRGREMHSVKFSIDDAKRAGLWGKAGPWTTYPKRMLQMRARGFALRDTFPDALKGLCSAEEQQDIPANNVKTPIKNITPRVSEDQLYQINAYIRDLGKTQEYIDMILNKKAGVSKLEDLPADFADEWIAAMCDQSWAIDTNKEEKNETL